MGLLGAALVMSFRYPKGATRTQLQMLAAQVLIPSLVPLAPAASGQHVDFGAHLGGALGGAAIGAVMLALWSRQSPLPKLGPIAAAAAAAWIAAGLWSLYPVTQAHAKARHDIELRALLIPESEMPKAADARAASSEDLVARFPRDPRARLYRATAFLDQNDLQKAEQELRLALKEEEILQSFFQPAFAHALRATLAFTLVDAGRMDEAKQAAKPACGRYEAESDSLRANFKKLCE
jgi:rhomboid protease GluP